MQYCRWGPMRGRITSIIWPTVAAKLQTFTVYLLMCLSGRSHLHAVWRCLPFWDLTWQQAGGVWWRGRRFDASHLYPFCARLTLGCKGPSTASEQWQRWRRISGSEHRWCSACLKCAILAMGNFSENKNILQTIIISCQTGHLGAVLWLFIVTGFAVP